MVDPYYCTAIIVSSMTNTAENLLVVIVWFCVTEFDLETKDIFLYAKV